MQHSIFYVARVSAVHCIYFMYLLVKWSCKIILYTAAGMQ